LSWQQGDFLLRCTPNHYLHYLLSSAIIWYIFYFYSYNCKFKMYCSHLPDRATFWRTRQRLRFCRRVKFCRRRSRWSRRSPVRQRQRLTRSATATPRYVTCRQLQLSHLSFYICLLTYHHTYCW